MTITLIAHTQLADFNGHDIAGLMTLDEDSTQEEDLLEFAGRSCYNSFHRPNELTRRNSDYLRNIIGQHHTSVLEHASASFYVTGHSRNMLLELTRHRHLSFSVRSTRYVDESDAQFINPPTIPEFLATHDSGEGREAVGAASQALRHTHWAYQELVEVLTKAGYPRKQAREAARSILPGGTETRFVVSGNLRAWRDVLSRRWSTHADREIQQFAHDILVHLKERVAPTVFEDFDLDRPFT